MKDDDDTLLDMEGRKNERREDREHDLERDGPSNENNTPTTLFAIQKSTLHLDDDNRKTDAIPVIADVVVTAERALNTNRFQLLEKVGGGAMSEVFKARDMRFAGDRRNPIVAVKITRNADITWGEQADARVKNEAYFARKIASPNVGQVYDLLKLPDGSWAIIQEFIEGRTLASIIKSGEKISWLRMTRWAIDIAGGLHAAHGEGIVHRDLKPENIMIRASDDSAVILDFGVAKLFGPNEVCLTQQGNVVGTVLYMAPEQLQKKTDPRSDFYALGLTLVRLSTGHVPRSGDHCLDSIIFERVHEPKPFRFRNHAPDAPAELAMVIDRLLETHPRDRFQTGADIIGALEAFLALAEAETRITRFEDFIRDTRILKGPPRPPPPPPISLVRRVSSGNGSASVALHVHRSVTPLPSVREVPLLPILVAAAIVMLVLLFASLARASGQGASPPRELSTRCSTFNPTTRARCATEFERNSRNGY